MNNNKKKYWVTMTDRFMSGWGGAKDKTNKYIVECETWGEAILIERHAQSRPEMKYVNICVNNPRYGSHVVESRVKYSELGEIWQKGKVSA